MSGLSTQKSENRNKGAVIQLLASIITIIVFITGIQSVPEMMGFHTPNGIMASDITTSWSYGLLLISHGAYYLSLYIIIRLLGKVIVGDGSGSSILILFLIVVFSMIGMGLTTLLYEGFYGKIDTAIENGEVISLIIYGLISAVLNIFTARASLEFRSRRYY